MTSEKAYDNAQRLNAAIPRIGALESGAGWLTNSPPVFDHWQDTAGLQNGWGKGTGYWKFVHILPRIVWFKCEGLTTGTATDGTIILSSANGFPSGYRPPDVHSFPAWTDNLKVGTATYEGAQIAVQTDGSVTIRGFNASATVLASWGMFPTLWY
jgi:hypothetical protein